MKQKLLSYGMGQIQPVWWPGGGVSGSRFGYSSIFLSLLAGGATTTRSANTTCSYAVASEGGCKLRDDMIGPLGRFKKTNREGD